VQEATSVAFPVTPELIVELAAATNGCEEPKVRVVGRVLNGLPLESVTVGVSETAVPVAPELEVGLPAEEANSVRLMLCTGQVVRAAAPPPAVGVLVTLPTLAVTKA
jgi:hypothetical protein